MYAGPLWRDETNTHQRGADALAEGVMEHRVRFHRFGLLLLRGCGFLGLAGQRPRASRFGTVCRSVSSRFHCGLLTLDGGARTDPEHCAAGQSASIYLPSMGANRAYGLANCLLVLSFGMIWRMVEFRQGRGFFWPVSPAFFLYIALL